MSEPAAPIVCDPRAVFGTEYIQPIRLGFVFLQEGLDLCGRLRPASPAIAQTEYEVWVVQRSQADGGIRDRDARLVLADQFQQFISAHMPLHSGL